MHFRLKSSIYEGVYVNRVVSLAFSAHSTFNNQGWRECKVCLRMCQLIIRCHSASTRTCITAMHGGSSSCQVLSSPCLDGQTGPLPQDLKPLGAPLDLSFNLSKCEAFSPFSVLSYVIAFAFDKTGWKIRSVFQCCGYGAVAVCTNGGSASVNQLAVMKTKSCDHDLTPPWRGIHSSRKLKLVSQFR